MLIQSLRPQFFSQVVGNKLNNDIMMTLAKNPDNGPSTLILQGSFGSGKAIDEDSIISTPSGNVRAGDIHIGDYLFDPKGCPTKVTAVYHQGVLDSYKVTFEDGRIVYCNNEHLWACVNQETGKLYAKTTDELRWLIYGKHDTVFIPVTQPVCYSKKELPIPPYLFGLLLCNSYEGKSSLLYRNDKFSYYDYMKEQTPKLDWVGLLKESLGVPTDSEGNLIDVDLIYGEYRDMIKDHIIPDCYLQTCAKQRWLLLNAIMDCKATISNDNNVFCTIEDDTLRACVKTLSYSLGLIVTETGNMLYYKTNTDLIYKLFKHSVFLKSINPDLNDTIDVKHMAILSIEKEDTQRSMVCFTVDNKYHMYLCNDYIATHNTTTARLFAKALNCKNLKEKDICGKCVNCKADLNNVPWYVELDSSAINVDSVRDMRDMFITTSKSYNKVIVIDECLDYNSLILCRKDSTCNPELCRIGDLVTEKRIYEVASYNFDFGVFEWKRIRGWHKNSRKIVRKRKFITESGKEFYLTCSDKHVVFMHSGKEVCVEDLNEGDLVFVLSDYNNGSLVLARYIGIESERWCVGKNTYDITVADNHNYIADGVLVHNCHLLSKTAQSALLKVFEETPKGVFFLLATTDPDKLLQTIRSRSLELVYTPKTQKEVIADVEKHAKELGLSLSYDTLSLIASRSRGIMRNAHMLLDKVSLIGEETFLKNDIQTASLLNDYIVSILKTDRDLVLKTIDSLSRVPVAYLKEDWQDYFLNLMRASVDITLVNDDRMKKLVSVLGKQTVSIVKFCVQDWVIKSFQTCTQAQIAMLAIYQSLSKEQK